MIRPLAHASRLILQVPAGQRMQIAHRWVAVTNNPLDTEDVVTQCEREATHIHCEGYRETRTQRNIQYYGILLYQEQHWSIFLISTVVGFDLRGVAGRIGVFEGS